MSTTYLARSGRQATAHAGVEKPVWPPLGRWQPLAVLAQTERFVLYRAVPHGASVDGAATHYVVKTARPARADDPDLVSLLQTEALVGRLVCHRHVIPLLDFQVDRAPRFVVTPRLAGVNLSQVLKSADAQLGPAPLSPGVAVWLSRQMAQALQALHQAGWMHADIKPANIHVAPEGHVTVLDLGLAQPLGEPRGRRFARLAGTLDYMAPEMFTSVLAADIRSDIFSLGVVLFQLLTGQLPYAPGQAWQAEPRRRQVLADRLRVLAPHLPLTLSHLVRDMLASQPLRRPQTPAELVDRLVSLEIEHFDDRTRPLAD